MDSKFNQLRFEQMTKENYLSDPKKLVNQPGGYLGAANFNREGGFNRGGYQGGRGGRGGNRYGDREGGEGARFQNTRPYTDYDDPARYQNQLQNPERQIVSYDDLF